MMKILMTKDEVDISADLQGFQLVSRMISDFLLDHEVELTLTVDQILDPSPYMTSARELIVTKSDGPARISIPSPETLCLSGSIDNIGRFLSFLDYFDESSQDGDHNQFDGLAGDGFEGFADGNSLLPGLAGAESPRGFNMRFGSFDLCYEIGRKTPGDNGIISIERGSELLESNIAIETCCPV